MSRLFSRRKESVEEDCGPYVEVDQLSFDSFNDTDDDDLYMSVGQSPSDLIGKTGDAGDNNSEVLSMRSQHYTIPDKSSSTVGDACRVLERLIPSRLDAGDISSHRSSILSFEDEEFHSLRKITTSSSTDSTSASDDNMGYLMDLIELPPIINAEPYWRDHARNYKLNRQRDAEVSKDQEQSNLSIYAAKLTLEIMEEARWMNDISKDPLLSRLVNETDIDFPLAVRIEPCDSSSPRKISVKEESYSQPVTVTTTNSTFYVDPSAKVESAVPSTYNGVDGIVLRRAKEYSSADMCTAVLLKYAKVEPIRDARVAVWMDDAIQHSNKLINLPTNSINSDEVLCNGHIVRIRGTADWAPPRDAWIFTLWKNENNKGLLESQKFRCAGCGVKIEKEYVRRMRYCEYYGKLFCQCCHQGAKSIIPAKILHLWNFNEFSVSDQALQFLRDAKNLPSIHVTTVVPQLVNKIKILKHVIILREKLSHMWEFIKRCHLAEGVVTQHGNLSTMFASLDRHLLSDCDIFSLSDLCSVFNKDLPSHLEPIVYYGRCHIEACENCRLRAFVCTVCVDATDLLFPFQVEKAHRCPDCGSLSHIRCQSRQKKKTGSNMAHCPKCIRLQKLRNRQRFQSITGEVDQQ